MGHGKKSATTIKDCIFSGSISGGTHVGVLWGWSDSGCTPTIQNCLEKGTSYTGTNVNPVGLISTWGYVGDTYYLTAQKGWPNQYTTRGTQAYTSTSAMPSGAPHKEVTAADGKKYYVVDSPEGLSIDTDYSYGTTGFYYVNMPKTGTNTLTLSDASVTTFKVYDDGGKSDNYSKKCAGTLTLTAPEGYVLQLSGNITTENNYDYLTVYDGSTTSGTKLLDAVSSTGSGTQTDITTVTSTGQSMTIYFHSNGNTNYAGLDLTVTLISASTEHDITVNAPTGGSVAASVSGTSVSAARVNDVVTLTATPNSGYVLSGLSVTDANNNALAVNWDIWANTATFNMPAWAVTVTPTFTKTADGLSVNMPTTGTKTVTIPSGVQSFKVYDDGGASGNYSANCAGTLTLTAPEGYVLQLSGSITTETPDHLTVYDGSDNQAKKLLNAVSSTTSGNQTAINTVNSTGQSMTL